MVSEVTVSSYPSTDPVLLSRKTSSVIGSSLISDWNSLPQTTQLRSTRSRIA